MFCAQYCIFSDIPNYSRYIGLPPSWSTQLSSAGFTPEEIAAIQTRRANLYNNAPNLRINTTPPTTTTPILSHPSPRTPSLKGQFSDTLIHSTSQVRPKIPPQIASSTGPQPARHGRKSPNISNVKVYRYLRERRNPTIPATLAGIPDVPPR